MVKKIKHYFLEKLYVKILKDLGWKVDYEDMTFVNGNDVENDLTLANRKCHQNSFDVFKKKKHMKIKLCYTRQKNNNYGFVHFINYNTKTDTYFDNTLGSTSPDYNHYILNENWIESKLEENIVKPWLWLKWAKEDFYNKYCDNWLWRLFIEIDDL